MAALPAREPARATAGAARSAVLPRTRAPEDASAAADVPDQPRYERIRPLGEGGMGEVVLALDHDIERKVAIKRLRPEVRSPGALLRFAEEVRAVGQLEHPGIAPVYDVGIDEEGHHYQVMKYLEGETLEAIIEKLKAGDPAARARFSHAYRAQVFAAVLEAVSYAHDRGLVHRDLKPANVMVGPHGEVTVLDWGIAKRAGAPEPAPFTAAQAAAPLTERRLIETQQGAILGTPMYMSPEQAVGDGAAVGPRSDVYSLAVMFWELMSLHHPLEDKESIEDILAALTGKEIPTTWFHLTRTWTGAPCEWAWFARKGMRKDPGQRFASATEMLAELRKVQRGDIAVDCHVTLVKRGIHEADGWINRHAIVFNLLTLLVVLGSIAGLVWLALGVAHRLGA
jgi:serine/threonine-protein kinase